MSGAAPAASLREPPWLDRPDALERIAARAAAGELDAAEAAVSYTHLTLPTIYSV